MYKLMIVEDEALARDAMLKMIDFQKQGFEVVAVCEDGQQAADCFEHLSPDLVITDICMPFFSGLQLAARIAEADRGTQVIIITGYDDFNYAKEAIKNQVASYVLKPVTPTEFVEVLAEARRKLDEQQVRLRQISQAERQIHRSSPLVRDQILNRLIQGSADLPEIERDLVTFGVRTDLAFYQVAVILIDALDQAKDRLRVNRQLLQYMVSNVAAELAGGIPDFVSFQLADGRSAIIGAGPDAPALDLQLKALARQVHDSLLQVLNLGVTLGCGQPVAILSDLRHSYMSAQRCLDHKFLMPHHAILYPDIVRQEAQSVDLSSFEDPIILQVKLRDEAQTRLAVTRFIQAIPLVTQSKSDVQFEISRLLGRLTAAVKNESGESARLPEQNWSDAEDSQYLDALSSWLIDYCLACITLLSSRRNGENQLLSIRASQYILAHYADSHLSLLEVCNHLAVSMSHFSQVFKDETGQTFVEFLTGVRMEKAKELLRSSSRMLYDIAELVGYETPAYFTVAFKKHVGLNPRDYRKQFGQVS